jgi:hypothetical protein
MADEPHADHHENVFRRRTDSQNGTECSLGLDRPRSQEKVGCALAIDSQGSCAKESGPVGANSERAGCRGDRMIPAGASAPRISRTRARACGSLGGAMGRADSAEGVFAGAFEGRMRG